MTYKTYGVSAAHPLAAEAGVKILEEGGNAVDAAIAVTFALGVVEPYASGIGGGGNMLIYPRGEKDPVLYDYRETAPNKIHPTYHIGVPGVVSGMEKIAKEHGTRSLAEVMQPAIELAERGFPINEIIARNLRETKHTLMVNIPHFYPNKQALKPGDILIQTALAETMKQVATEGAAHVYQGSFAQKMVDLNVGITKENLQAYQTVTRKPIQGIFRGHEIYTAPAPSGGALIVQALRIIEQLNLDQLSSQSPTFMATVGRILQTCYFVRDTYIGEPGFVPITEERLLDETFIKKMAKAIENEENPPEIKMPNANHTTHFSVIDGDGMVVSTTNTLSNYFGSGVYVDGLFLNNQMQNFSNEHLSPNRFEVGKRCHNLIAPTIVSDKTTPWLAIGASGAARIPTLITAILIKYIIHGQSIEEAIQSPRHYSYDTDFYSEKDLSMSEQQEIDQLGYRYHYYPNPTFYGGVQAVVSQENKVHGAGDPRRGGVFRNEKGHN